MNLSALAVPLNGQGAHRDLRIVNAAVGFGSMRANAPGASSSRRTWPRAIGRWLVWSLVPNAAALWVATLLVPSFAVAGPWQEQLVLLTAVAGVHVGMATLVTTPARRTLLLAAGRQLREPPDFGGSDWEFFRPWRRFMGLLGLVHVLDLSSVVVLRPATLWVSVRLLGDLLGLPVQLTGLWPTVVAAVLTAAVGRLMVRPFALLRRRTQAQVARELAQYALCVAGLWLALALLAGVRLEPGPAGASVLTVVALAALFNHTVGWLWLSLPVPGVVPAVLVAANALRLWLTSWFSGVLVLSLEVAGGWTFLLAVLLISVAMAPARVADRAARSRSSTLHHDPFWHHPSSDWHRLPTW